MVWLNHTHLVFAFACFSENFLKKKNLSQKEKRASKGRKAKRRGGAIPNHFGYGHTIRAIPSRQCGQNRRLRLGRGRAERGPGCAVLDQTAVESETCLRHGEAVVALGPTRSRIVAVGPLSGQISGRFPPATKRQFEAQKERDRAVARSPKISIAVPPRYQS